mgnify:FL=1
MIGALKFSILIIKAASIIIGEEIKIANKENNMSKARFIKSFRLQYELDSPLHILLVG